MELSKWARDEGIEDAFALPANLEAATETLCDRMSEFLVFKCLTTPGRQSKNGKVKSPQVRQWCNMLGKICEKQLKARKVSTKRTRKLFGQDGLFSHLRRKAGPPPDLQVQPGKWRQVAGAVRT